MEEVDQEGGRFKRDLKIVFSDIIKSDPEVASELWSAISGIMWCHEDGETAQLNINEASETIQSLLDEEYSEPWWVYGPDGVVSTYIERVMQKEGWTWT